MYIRRVLPYVLKKRLWGDRKSFGLTPDINDSSWIEWNEVYTKFYINNQRGGIGEKVNDIGYSILKKVNLNGKNILEIGPGDIRHLKYWKKGRPQKYILADVSNEMMQIAEDKLNEYQVEHEKIFISRNKSLPIDDESVDIIISFYSLEHIYPLENYLKELSRVLRKNGTLVGAIPTEGGFFWGLGRYLTTRRWFKKNTNINPDKIICWEHPNFADLVISKLDTFFKRKYLKFSPFHIHSIDLNLVVKFLYKKE